MVRISSTDGYADAIIGLQHGDEGKARFVDALAEEFDWVVRFNGGANAGHTVESDGQRYVSHQVPSGLLYPKKRLFIGAQCVVNVQKLLEEIQEAEKANISLRNRLRISAQASLIQPGHIIRDKATMGAVGTTGNGIGAAYADQALRVEGNRQLDIRLGMMLAHLDDSLASIRRNLEVEIERYHVKDYDVDGEMDRLHQAFLEIRHCIEKDPTMLLREIRSGMRVLLEGAQAFGLDRTFGVTPDVTSSNTGVAAAFLSAGIPVEYKRRAYGIAKMIPTRVGHGPFVPEFGRDRSEEHCMSDGGKKHTQEVERALYGERIDELLRSADPLDIGIALRLLGKEYGATTKRPRRIGMFDEVQLRQAIDINGIDGLYFTKGDCLKDFARTRDRAVPVVTAYELDGQRISFVPSTKEELRQAQPVVRHYDAFGSDLSDVREDKHLPVPLLELLRDTQDRLGATILAVGVGPRREQVVHLNGAM